MSRRGDSDFLLLLSRASGGTPTPTTDDTAWYGQSNSLNHIGTASSPPAATAGTQVWDPGTSAWITPVGNGIREYLNAVTAATGLPARVVYGGQSGVPISSLQKGAGTGYYEALLARIAAAGISPRRICFHQGEGDGNSISPNAATYQAAMDTLHGSIVADLGLTKSSCPMIISSLANVTDGSFSQPDLSWSTIKAAQATVNASYPNIYYSHSNMDAVLSDGVHWTAASYGRSGKRYARTAQVLLGSVSTYPKWFATAAERISDTETDITIVHEMGSDFTPTSGITGFELTGNNGSSWVTGTGARTVADKIRVTHTGLGTTERKVRYQFGKTPTVSALVLDDGSLTVPLNFTTTDLVAAGAAALPVITYIGGAATVGNAQTQTHSGSFAVSGASEALLALIGITSTGGVYSSATVTAQPSGSAIAATLVEAHTTSNPRVMILQAELPVGTTSLTVSVTFTANPFTGSYFRVATIPVASLSSTTKVGSGKATATSVTTASATLATTAGGVVFVMAADNSIVGGNSGTLTGTETYATRNSVISQGSTTVVGDASNVATDAASSVTVTYGNAANTTIVAASWR